MKRFYGLVAAVCFASACQLFAKKEEVNFSLKNKSDRKIYVTFKDRDNKDFFLTYAQSLSKSAIPIKPGSELTAFNPKVTSIGSLTVEYCKSGPNNCECEDVVDIACQERKEALSSHTVRFGYDPENIVTNYLLKFSLEDDLPEVWVQEGRFGFLTPGRSKNISNGAIVGNPRRVKKAK